MKTAFVSVIIPTKNSEKTLEECLKSLKNQTYPKNKYEIIIIDDHSMDGTLDIAKKYGAKIITSNGPPGRQRNKGISKSKGSIIGLIDSDCIAKKDWISEGLKYFISKETAVVGGPNLTPKNDPFISQCVGYVSSSKIGTGSMSARYLKDGFYAREADETSLISCNMFVLKDAIKKVNGFDESLFPNEENELMFRIKERGYKLIYVPSLLVWHHRRASIKKFFMQNLTYGTTRVQFIKKHPRALKLIHLFPSIFVLGLCAGPLLLFAPFIIKIIYLSGIVSYVLLIFASSLNKTIKIKNIKLLGILPILFFLLHTAYGIGVLKGLLKKD